MVHPLSRGTWYTPYNGINGTPLIKGYMVHPLSSGTYMVHPLSWGTWYTPYHGVHGTPLIKGYILHFLPGVYSIVCIIMNHNSRDDKGVGVAHKIVLPKNSSFPDDNGAVLVKPKQAFGSTQNAFKKLRQNFKNRLFNGILYLTN